MQFTCIFTESASDAPPLYPDPLIYVVEMSRAPASLCTDHEWNSEATEKAEAQRAGEVDFESNLQLVLAFPGDLSPASDARQ